MAVRGSISSLERAAALRRLSRESFDLVLIGGGITGAGIAFEAARRGLAVALLEAQDFAAGTSSRSTKLIHGGLRYLAMGDVALVRETALERKEIFRIAPHLAEPRWMLLPTRSRVGLMKFRVAISTYETLGAVEKHDRHENWDRRDLEREEPLIDRSRFPFACAYREYLTDDARLVIANLRGAAGRGAAVLNHAPVVDLVEEEGQAVGVEVRCAESQERFMVRGRCIVNAAGPWVEQVRRLEWPDAPPWLHLSRGIHISLPVERLPLNHLIMMRASDRRTVFAMRRAGVTYIGTTDTSAENGPELWPGIKASEVDYLLEPLPRYFDTEPLRRADVIGAWAGLRPLIAQPGKAPKDLSRKDEITIGPKKLVSIAGGKLTGYRPMACQVLAKVEEVLGEKLPEPPDNADDVLPGGDFDGDLDSLARRVSSATGLPTETTRPLARLYGDEVLEVLRGGCEPVAPGARLFSGELDWAICQEGAVTVEDVLYRRNRAALWAPASARSAVEPVADRMAARLGWDRARRAREVERTLSRLDADLGFET